MLKGSLVNARQPIDDLIVQRRIATAIRAIRAAEECSLQRALDVFYERYDFLRRTRAHDFTVSHEEYWQGVYRAGQWDVPS
ncbi:hypothetical protein [Micromonospora sp. WMMD980]|uniref:hypothetical protein n=1 Tax=Micromonospora sp. WMMD980 TaxID=3016088 RepID=UPI0024171825|nr:hypothetical protein [Micromonospora sp. WMMD980]MDG4800118.1 hypothetical protein [Micromonospora sp. WMMD980]